MGWCWLRQLQDRTLAPTSSAVKDSTLPRVERPSCSDGNNTGGASNQLPFLPARSLQPQALLCTCIMPQLMGSASHSPLEEKVALVIHVLPAGHPGHGKPECLFKIKLPASRCCTITHGLSKEQSPMVFLSFPICSPGSPMWEGPKVFVPPTSKCPYLKVPGT